MAVLAPMFRLLRALLFRKTVYTYTKCTLFLTQREHIPVSTGNFEKKDFEWIDWTELRSQTDQWWRVLAQCFAAEGLTCVPAALNRHADRHNDWYHPQLLMSQTCGYPLRYQFRDVLTVVAVPRYTAEGCKGANYCSMVVVRKDDGHLTLSDFSGRCAAFNGEDSQSGYSALRAVIAPLAQGGRFFSDTLKTGTHLKSMAAVVSKKADICAIDCVGWALANRLFPDLVSKLCIIAQTPSAPSLPYVTSRSCSDDNLQRLRRGLLRAVEDKEHKELRTHLLIDGFDFLAHSAYERIERIEKSAIDAGYPALT